MWSAGNLTWRAGPARGCDVALSPRSKAARGPRKANRAWTRGRRPCVSTRVHMGARVGRHVAEGSADGGPTG